MLVISFFSGISAGGLTNFTILSLFLAQYDFLFSMRTGEYYLDWTRGKIDDLIGKKNFTRAAESGQCDPPTQGQPELWDAITRKQKGNWEGGPHREIHREITARRRPGGMFV
jgi:hypothetical protein